MNRFRLFLMIALCLALMPLSFAQTPAETASPTSAHGNGSAPPPATVTGSGTTDYLPLWTGSATLGNSHIFQSAGNTGIGNTSPQWALDVAGHINSSSGYLIGESLVLTQPGGVADANIALGYQALLSDSTGS